MATLTDSTLTRSTRIVPASRPRLTMPLLRALDTIGVVETQLVRGGRGSVSCAVQATLGAGQVSRQAQVSRLVQVTGPVQAVGTDYHHDHNSITTNDVALLLDSHKPCGVVDDRGSMKDAFAISLGSRPPSPPTL